MRLTEDEKRDVEKIIGRSILPDEMVVTDCKGYRTYSMGGQTHLYRTAIAAAYNWLIGRGA